MQKSNRFFWEPQSVCLVQILSLRLSSYHVFWDLRASEPAYSSWPTLEGAATDLLLKSQMDQST